MTTSNEQFEEAYRNATPAQKYLCSGAGNELMDVAKKHNLTEPALYKRFALLVGDVVLGFYKTEDLPILLQQEFGFSKETIDILFKDILTFMNPLYDPAWQPPAASETAADINSLITETESAIATLPTIRTMNQTEPVYSSTQAAILREGGEIGAGSATPKTHPSEAPTWDSAR